MPNQTENGSGQSAPSDVESHEQTAEVQAQGAPLCGNTDQFTEEELAQIAELAKEGGAREATIRGHRVIIVADMHHPRHLALAALAQLAASDALVVRPNDKIVGRELELPDLSLKMLEPVIVAEPDDERRGKGRKAWQSPHDFHGGKQKMRQPQRNIKQMLRRRGGR